MSDCIFCDIAQKQTRSKIIYETEEFIVIENIDPQAPFHVLVMPKKHIEKTDAISGRAGDNFWNKMISVCNEVIRKEGLDKTGYRLVNNGAGYNGIAHEHMHILGGSGWKP